MTPKGTQTFERHESEVRSYCRDFPVVFDTAHGATLVDEEGNEYLDFFAGAGALNYGHNPTPLKEALLEWVGRSGVTHSLDMYTTAKRDFLHRFHEVILAPRGMDHRVMFPGPTGTNAVEAALKIARKATGRSTIISFTNGFHGMTLGSLALTGNATKRGGAGVPLHDVVQMPFDGYHGDDVDSIEMIERLLSDPSSGIEAPAAFVLETVQAEGGVNTASFEWLKRLGELAKKTGALLVIDDIQVGCGRTGPFFSFEPAGIEPDIICLSKSLSGYGLPFAVVLLRPEHDVFTPGEHNGTFRGHNPAFVTATAALEFWKDDTLTRQVDAHAAYARSRFQRMARGRDMSVRGRGLIQGLVCPDGDVAGRICAAAFERGLIIETAGAQGEVVKLLPPLTVTAEELERGLDMLSEAVEQVMGAVPVPTRNDGREVTL